MQTQTPCFEPIRGESKRRDRYPELGDDVEIGLARPVTVIDQVCAGLRGLPTDADGIKAGGRQLMQRVGSEPVYV